MSAPATESLRLRRPEPFPEGWRILNPSDPDSPLVRLVSRRPYATAQVAMPLPDGSPDPATVTDILASDGKPSPPWLLSDLSRALGVPLEAA